MYLLTSQEMQLLDGLSIHRYKIPSIKLMERAGKEVFQVIQRSGRTLKGKKFFIFCGPGNNGGDGLVVARHLLKKRAKVFVFLLADPNRLKGDPLVQLKKLKGVRSSYGFYQSFTEIRKEYRKRGKPDWIIDALFGTGLSRSLSGIYRKLIPFLNKPKSVRVSIDIPSGLNANTGEVLGCAFKADTTVSLGYPKRGFFLKEARDYVGRLHVVPIGLSSKAIKQIDPITHLITKKEVLNLLKPRLKTSHKGSFGHVYTIGGSIGKIGAGVMAAHTSLKVGAGLSTLVLPESAYKKIDPRALEIMYEPVGKRGKGYFRESDLPYVLNLLKKANVAALGPGLGSRPETFRFVHGLIQKYRGPLVIDADGLNAVAKRPSVLKKRRGLTLLTPHPGEMSRLIRKSTRYVQRIG